MVGRILLKKTHTPAKRSHDITFQEMYKGIWKKRMDYYLFQWQIPFSHSSLIQVYILEAEFWFFVIISHNILRLAWHPAVIFLFLQWRCEVNGSIVASDWLPLSMGYINFLQSSTKEKGWQEQSLWLVKNRKKHVCFRNSNSLAAKPAPWCSCFFITGLPALNSK